MDVLQRRLTDLTHTSALGMTAMLDKLNIEAGQGPTWECTAAAAAPHPAAGALRPDAIEMSTDCHDLAPIDAKVLDILNGLQNHTDTQQDGSRVTTDTTFGAHPHLSYSQRSLGVDDSQIHTESRQNGIASATSAVGP